MGNGPLVVVSPDGAQLDSLLSATRRALPGSTTCRLVDGNASLLARHIYFLLLPPSAPLPSALLGAADAGASLVWLGERGDFPQDVEIFHLGPREEAAVPILLQALVRRECSYCRVHRSHDQAAAEISRALIAEVADLQHVLAVLGHTLRVNRVTLFQLRGDGLVADATHEWCSAGTRTLLAIQPAIDKRTLLWLLPQLEIDPTIRIDDTSELPFTAFTERVLAVMRGLHAVLIAPLRTPGGELRGALVAEDTQGPHPWTGNQERLLLLAGEMLANYLERQAARAAARDSESVQGQVLEHIQDGVFLTAADRSRVIYVSPPAAQLWGMPAEELMAAPDRWLQVIHPGDRERVFDDSRTVGAPGATARASEFRILRADDGEERWIRARTFPVRNGAGEVDRIAGLLEDVTEQRRQQNRVRLLARVFETTGEAVMITDAGAGILDVNPAFTRITGYAREEVIGRNPRIMASGRHDRSFYEKMWQSLLGQGHWHGEVWDRRKDGVEYPKLLTINAIADELGAVSNYVGIFNDISDVKETEARLQHMAHHDPLTGLPNRLLFRDRLERAVAQAARSGEYLVGVMFLDLDGFKEINDTLGHKAGDTLLVEVARRLCEQLRESDTLARLGGDEFTAILTHLGDHTGAERVGRKFVEALAQPFQIGAESVQVTASIGISLYPHTAQDVDTLLRSADRAMYTAKYSGRNRLCFSESAG